MTTTTLRLPPRIARLPQLRQIVRGGLAARGSVGAGLAAKAGGAAGNGLLNSLVAYWPLNEAAGANNALDLHANALTLTQVDSPGADTGKVYSTARTFRELLSAQYFSRLNEALLQTGNIDFTLASWVYVISKADYRSIINRDTFGVNREFWLFYDLSVDRYAFLIGNAGTIQSVPANNFGSPGINAWHFVIAWHDAAAMTINIQINNGTIDSANRTVTPAVANVPLSIAAASTFYRFAGRLGPVMFWKSAPGGGGVLSAAQRTALFNSGNGLAYSAFTT